MLSVYDLKRILGRGAQPAADDIRIIDSWAEYKEDERCPVEERKLEYLCYEMEVMNPDTGERKKLYKALCFARVIRLPKEAKQSLSLMDMHEQLLSGVYERKYNLVTVICNIIRPVALGLLFLYGVQGVAYDIDAAKEIAHRDFLGFLSMLQGTYRVLEMRVLQAQESEWLREKMYGMEHIAAVRGIPKASKGGENAGNKGFGGQNLNPQSQGTMEEIISGMSDFEYVIEVLSSPVRLETLKAWALRTQDDMTNWNDQLQGVKSVSMNLSMPMMFAANLGQSEGSSHAYTDADSVSFSQNETFSTGYGESVGQSLSESISQSFGRSEGASVTDSFSRSHNISQGESIGSSFGQNLGLNEGISSNESLSENAGINFSHGENISESLSHSQGNSYNVSQGHNISSSHNIGNSQNFGISQGESFGESTGVSIGNSVSHSIGESFSENVSNSQSQSTGFSQNSSVSNGMSAGFNTGNSNNQGVSESGNNGWNAGAFGFGFNGGESSSESSGVGNSTGSSFGLSEGSSSGVGYTNSSGIGYSHGYGYGSSESVGNTQSIGQSASVSHGVNIGTSQNWGVNESFGVSEGESVSQGWGANSSVSEGQSFGESASEGWSQGIGKSVGVGQNRSVSQGMSLSDNLSRNIGESYGESRGQSFGRSQSVSETQGYSQGQGSNWGQNRSVGQSLGTGQGISNSQGESVGRTLAKTMGTSGSMGLGPSIGYNRSYQWLDQGVKDILELLEFQNERIKSALRGQGAFYTYVYIATEDNDALEAASALAKSTWQNENAMMSPVQVMNLEPEEQSHLLYHFSAFSVDASRIRVHGVEEYKYSTVLLPSEYVSYTHLPRISEGGIFAEVADIPKFSVPSMMKGEIFLGNVLSAERYTLEQGYKTPYEYRMSESELMHGFVCGASRSGKTVAAMRLVAELAHVRRKKTGKRLRIVVMDPKRDWRALARLVEPERLKFNSLGNLQFHPLRLNVCKIPHGVWPQTWIDAMIEIYCRAYGLLERGKQLLGETLYSLYDEAGVFAACDRPDWADVVSDLSAQVTLTKAYERMTYFKRMLDDPTNAKGRAGNDTRDAYARLLDRLSAFGREYSIERRLFGSEEGIGIDELIGDDDITILESKGLESTFKNFIFGTIVSGFFRFALAHEEGFLSEDQYETCLVIEEANEVLVGNDMAGSGSSLVSLGGQSEFESVLDQSAGYGLFVFAITQKISDLPKSVIANSGIILAGKMKTEDDVKVVIRSIAREERYEDRDILKWLPRSPIGWFICQSSRCTDYKDAEPVLVKIAKLNVAAPSNAELDEILAQRDAIKKLKEVAG